MRINDLHQLPKFRDAVSTLYVEHCRIEKEAHSIAFYDDNGETPVPASALAVLMLGPGSTISHAAITALADNNCLVIWCGEENVRFYAAGMGGTRSAYSLLHQARMASFEEARLEVVKRMYRRRFGAPMDGHQTVEQLRGMEGVRVREAYAKASRDSGVPWSGRNYDRGNWATADPVNRALSCANSCLYGLCHAAILSAGYSPAIGFIHTGKQLSFVYDIADLYKVEITIPLAFRITGESPTNLERAVRQSLRDSFRASKLMQRVIPDIRAVLAENVSTEDFLGDADPALPESLWTPQAEAGIRSGEFAPDYDPFRELESSPPPHVSMSNFESAKDGQEPAVYDPFADE